MLCDIGVPEYLGANFANFPPIFKNTLVSKNDIRDSLCRRIKINVSTSKNVDNQLHITKWNTYYSSTVILSTSGSCLHKKTPFCWIQSKEMLQQFCALSSRLKKARWRKSKLKCRQRKNEVSSQQLLWLPDHGPEPTHCNKVSRWQKTHASNNSKLLKKLDHVNKALYEVELAKAQIEHKEPIIVGFFILQNAKLRMLELYYNFFTKFCDVNKFEEMEMDADSLYSALAEKELEDCIRPEMRADWQRLRSKDCVDCLFKEEFRFTEMLCLRSKTYCCYDVTSNKLKLSSKGLNKRVLEQSGDGPLERYRRVLNEKINVTSNNRGFRTNNHSVATFEQVKKSLSYFYPKRIVETDGIHTQPLNL